MLLLYCHFVLHSDSVYPGGKLLKSIHCLTSSVLKPVSSGGLVQGQRLEISMIPHYHPHDHIPPGGRSLVSLTNTYPVLQLIRWQIVSVFSATPLYGGGTGLTENCWALAFYCWLHIHHITTTDDHCLLLVFGSVLWSFSLRVSGVDGAVPEAVVVQKWTLIVGGLTFLLSLAAFPLSPLTNQKIVVAPTLLKRPCHRGSTIRSHQNNEEI